MMRPLAALLATALVAPSRCFEVPGAVAALGAKYADSMAARPLLTKMGTSAAIFGASDASAQALERAPALDRTRLAVTTAIGGFYFAPAAHVWYGAITKAIPANDLRAILTKALLGQLIFGPLVTCLQSPEGLKALPGKIRSDLLGVQAAGLGFWPFVDLVSYACLPVDYIPVFVNGASFVWTIFLSFKSRAAKRAP
ncbi:peroxisomal membrane protein [Aureococcus anophagefferens]|uniref:Peroxisomal membrane protein n=1 Tax=Aureococcus anophagefferens TaxID=44056 RepID=A0ABR1FZR2_AURAN|nr:hypothetical protein JL722_724 [Aureococcus anophagefferens]